MGIPRTSSREIMRNLLHLGDLYALNVLAYAVHGELEVITRVSLDDIIYFPPQELLQGVRQLPGAGLACQFQVF